MKNYLEHLSEDEIKKLISDYYQGEMSVKEIKEKYSLAYKGTSINSILPTQELMDICQYCNVHLIGKFPPRSRAEAGVEDIRCPNCGHKEGSYCNCKNCRYKAAKVQKEKEEEKRLILEKLLRSWPDGAIDNSDLELKDRVFLGALLRDGSTEEFSLIYSVNSNSYKLTPYHQYTSDSVINMYRESVIGIHKESDVNCFSEIVEKDSSFRFSPMDVCYYMNIDDENLSHEEIVDSLINPPILEEYELEEGYELWLEVAYYECLEYLEDTVQSLFKINLKVGEKTKLTLLDLLKSYSVSQIYNIIYYAGSRATRFKAENRVSNQHAANYLIGAARSYGERAKANNWDIKSYHRRKHLPQSSVSKFLYERVLGIGDKGFYSKPDKELIVYEPFPTLSKEELDSFFENLEDNESDGNDKGYSQTDDDQDNDIPF